MADKDRHAWWDIPVTIAIAVGVVLLVTTFLVKPFSIPSGSMENTLQIGDRVLANRVLLNFQSPERGDVVVFDGTDSFVPANAVPERNPINATIAWVGQSFGLVPSDNTDFIKRVIGVGGDRVICCDVDGRITVNDVVLDESSYLFPGNAPSLFAFDVQVPEGKLWVMGDHRSNSADSRSHMGDPGGGFVPESKVIGRAMNVLWPLDRLSILETPSTFEAVAVR